MSNYLRCGCEDGRDCTKTTVCHLEAAVEDQAYVYEYEIERLRAALERIANPITDDEVHWINTDEIVSIAREVLKDV